MGELLKKYFNTFVAVTRVLDERGVQKKKNTTMLNADDYNTLIPTFYIIISSSVGHECENEIRTRCGS